MQKNECIEFCNHLMANSEAVYLTTIDSGGYPYTRAMLNLRNKNQYPSLEQLFQNHQEDFLTYLTTSNSSVKISQILSNPKVSIYYCVPDKFHGLMVSGKITVLSDQHIKKTLWQKGWEQFYPKGHTDPDYAILELVPDLARGWYGEGPFELNLKDST